MAAHKIHISHLFSITKEAIYR